MQVLSGIMRSVAHSADERPVRPGARVALLVNSLGGTPALELGVVAAAAVRLARQRHEVCSWDRKTSIVMVIAPLPSCCLPGQNLISTEDCSGKLCA